MDGGPHHGEGCAVKFQVQFEAWGCECRAVNGSRERSWRGRKPQARGAGQTQTCALTSRAALGGCCGSLTTWHLQWHHKEGPRRGQGKEPWTPEGPQMCQDSEPMHSSLGEPSPQCLGLWISMTSINPHSRPLAGPCSSPL